MVDSKYAPLEQSDMAPESGHADQAESLKRSEAERHAAEEARAYASNPDADRDAEEDARRADQGPV